MLNLKLTLFALGAAHASLLKEGQVISHEEALAGLTAEFARDTHQDIELARMLMPSIPLDFQETQIELGDGNCEWTTSKTAKTYKREWMAWVKVTKSPVCRYIKYPANPYPKGMKWAQIKIWLKTAKGKAVMKTYYAARNLSYTNAKQYKFIDTATCRKVKGYKSTYMLVPTKSQTNTMVKPCLLPYPKKKKEKKKESDWERQERLRKEEDEKKRKEEERKKKEDKKKKKDDDSDDDDEKKDDDKKKKIDYKSGKVPDPIKPSLNGDDDGNNEKKKEKKEKKKEEKKKDEDSDDVDEDYLSGAVPDPVKGQL